jgi:hypothetical protein
MKVTLDLKKLVQDKHITDAEAKKLLLLAKKNETAHAFSILIIFSLIAIALGMVGLNSDLFIRIMTSIYDRFGTHGIHILVLAAASIGSYSTKSGFLSGISAFIILSLLGGSTFYSHASYLIAIREPAFTIIIFSALALSGLALSKKIEGDDERLVLIFSRVCLIIVNLGFWVGSLWGSKLGSHIYVPNHVFNIGWAIGLLAVGYWAAKDGRRFVVNTTTVFGSIHFYTQWFEKLGASPGSLLTAGLIALAILYGLREYNKNVRS